MWGGKIQCACLINYTLFGYVLVVFIYCIMMLYYVYWVSCSVKCTFKIFSVLCTPLCICLQMLSACFIWFGHFVVSACFVCSLIWSLLYLSYSTLPWFS